MNAPATSASAVVGVGAVTLSARAETASVVNGAAVADAVDEYVHGGNVVHQHARGVTAVHQCAHRVVREVRLNTGERAQHPAVECGDVAHSMRLRPRAGGPLRSGRTTSTACKACTAAAIGGAELARPGRDES
jgi:hypothetical protein